jgi:hypothetical protein
MEEGEGWWGETDEGLGGGRWGSCVFIVEYVCGELGWDVLGCLCVTVSVYVHFSVCVCVCVCVCLCAHACVLAC